MTYVLGIDQGTSQTTAVVLDEDGQVVASRSVRVPVQFPRPGWVEQDPWDLLRTVREAAGPLVAAYPIDAAGFDNQGETFVLWERATGQPLTPAIVWQDKRGERVCEALRPLVERDWLRRRTGLILDSYFSAPKLRFVFEQAPDLRRRAEAGEVCFGTTESWVLWHLSGGRLHVTDPSTASRTLLFNIETLAWDDELLRLFDVPRAMLPVVLPSAGRVGEVDFGAGRSVPLHGLAVDQQAALFGQACFVPGDVKCTFGTGSFLLMNLGAQPRPSTHGLLTTVAWQIPGQRAYALDGGIFVTGAAVQWLAEGLHFLPDAAASAEAATHSTDDQVVCIPALAGLAAPHWQTQVRGALFGLSRSTTPSDVVRATLDGIACRVVEVVQAMEQDAGRFPTQLKVDGGPSANPYLMQRLADLLDMEVLVASARESTAIGSAGLAAHSALGLSLEALAARWRAEASYTPQMPAAERQEHWERWQRALAAAVSFHAAESTRPPERRS